MANIDVKVKGINSLELTLTRTVNRVIKSDHTLAKVGLEAKDAVIGELKRGFTMARGQREKLKSLKPSTIANRQRMSKFNSTSNVYSARRSNVSLTGQYLDSFKTKVNKSLGTVFVFPDGSRRPYTTSANGNKSKNPPSNKELEKFLRKAGRPTVGGLSDRVTRRLKNVVLRDLRRKLKKAF